VLAAPAVVALRAGAVLLSDVVAEVLNVTLEGVAAKVETDVDVVLGGVEVKVNVELGLGRVVEFSTNVVYALNGTVVKVLLELELAELPLTGPTATPLVVEVIWKLVLDGNTVVVPPTKIVVVSVEVLVDVVALPVPQ